jgi:hypothetical protein
VPSAYAGDIAFDPDITQEEFHEFASVLGQMLYHTPVDAARSESLLGFDIGVMATAIEIDEDAEWWTSSIDSDFSSNGYVFAPRLVASKGIGFANVSASYGRVNDSDIDLIGAAVDIPILRGGLVSPTLAVRASYSTLRGIEELDLQTYGAEVFLSKAFGPLTPYGAVGMARTDATGRIPILISGQDSGTYAMNDEFDQERFTLGLRISLLVPKIVVEVTEGDQRTYAAKVSLGI